MKDTVGGGRGGASVGQLGDSKLFTIILDMPTYMQRV